MNARPYTSRALRSLLSFCSLLRTAATATATTRLDATKVLLYITAFRELDNSRIGDGRGGGGLLTVTSPGKMTRNIVLVLYPFKCFYTVSKRLL